MLRIYFHSCVRYIDYLRDLQLDNIAIFQQDVEKSLTRTTDGECEAVAHIYKEFQAKTLDNLMPGTKNENVSLIPSPHYDK